MANSRRSLGSDNHAGVHPTLWAAMQAANAEFAPSYGTDTWSDQAIQDFRTHFGKPCEVFFVFNGTGANVLSLAGLLQSYETALVAQSAHLNMDECAAPETMGRIKLQCVPTTDGKITPEQIEAKVIRRGDQHFAQLRAVSITQPSEYGTLYSIDELKAIGAMCRKHNLFLHMDGARFILAAERLGASFAAITRDVGVDVLSFGGTKNGMLMGEAVVVLREGLAERYKFLRKQMMQLPSKTRFISAQFSALLSQNLWAEISRHSCELATQLSGHLTAFPSVNITQLVQSNAVFAKIPKHYVTKLREKYFFYVWDESTFEVRLMTSFASTPDDIAGFVSLMKTLG